MRKNGKQPGAIHAEDKGFYIILVLCLAAIVISGYVLFFSPAARRGASTEETVYTPVTVPAADPAQTASGGVSDVPVSPAADADEFYGQTTAAQDQTKQEDGAAEQPEETVKTEETAKTEQTEKTEPEPAKQPAKPVWVRPVSGEAGLGYSGDQLVYQETFGDWRVHTGTDYTASSGMRVYAVADGKVEAVEQDSLWGTCLTLKTVSGETAVYRGLAEKTKVKQGASVKAGDILGTVAESVPAEAAQGAHLHFEMTKGDTPIDPETIFSGEKKQTSAQAEIPTGIDVEE